MLIANTYNFVVFCADVVHLARLQVERLIRCIKGVIFKTVRYDVLIGDALHKSKFGALVGIGSTGGGNDE